MSNNSIIEHRANYHYIMFHEDYVMICSEGKEYPHCKAFVLSILEHWMNDKLHKGQEGFVYMSYPQWILSMYGMFRRTHIINALTELVKENLIIRRSCRYQGKDTFEYALNVPEVQKRIRALVEKTEKNTRPNIDPSKFKRVQKQTDPNLDGSTHTNSNGSVQSDPSKFVPTIDTITNSPFNIDSSLSADADAGQSSQQQPSPAPTITPSSPSYSQLVTTHQPSPSSLNLSPDVPQEEVSQPSSQSVPALVTGPMTTGKPPVEPVEIPQSPMSVTLHPTSSLSLARRGVLHEVTKDDPPAVPQSQETEPLPRVYDRSVKMSDCPPEIQARRRNWQKHFNMRRGNEPLDQQGPRIEEAKAIADLVARYSDEQIRAIDTHVLGSFPYNQPGRQFEVSGTVVFAKSQTARQALREQRKWPRSPGEVEPVIAVAPLVATVHKSRYISSHLLT